MRIAIIQDHLRSGGTERQSIALAAGLASRGFTPSLIVFKRGGELDHKAATQIGVDIRYLPQGFLKTDWFAPRLAATLGQVEPEVVIAMGRVANCYAGWLAARSCRRYAIVATFRTGRNIPWLYTRALRRADHVVANSEGARLRLESISGLQGGDRISVIYNGCLHDAPLPTTPTEALNGAVLRLCSVSMFRPQKQQAKLIEICARIPENIEWELTLAGDGPTRSSCMRLAEQLGLANRIRFPGLVSDPSTLYAQSDFAVHVSRAESLPNFLIEAQSAGLPVIAYDVDGVGETFQHERSGFLIPSGDDETFLERLVELASDPARRHGMALAARRHAQAYFAPEMQINSYATLLRLLAERTYSRPQPA